MQQMRLDSKEECAAGWAGMADARNFPDRARATSATSAPDAGVNEPARSGLLRATLRFARNAGFGLLLLTSVPFVVVKLRSNHLEFRGLSDVRAKVSDAERARILTAPVDVSITPMDAGLAFAALQAPQLGAPVRSSPSAAATQQFPARAAQQQLMWPWRAHRPGTDMFEARSGGFEGPALQDAIYHATRGYTSAEMAWLKELAAAPVWKEFDKVGSAKAVDFIGGQYQLPFREDAFAPMMPFAKFAGTKELAYAGVARAAYYVAIGQPERAEAALRSVVSVGFALIDNGTYAIDALVGRVIVGIGQSGYAEFATYVGAFPPGYNSDPAPKTPTANYGNPRGVSMSVSEFRQQLLKDIYDPTLPRTVRLEQLNRLSMATCENIPEMWSGPNKETRAAFAMAATTLARYPSEKAQLEMMLDATNRVPDAGLAILIGGRLVVAPATVAAIITNNPRLATCTTISVAYR